MTIEFINVRDLPWAAEVMWPMAQEYASENNTKLVSFDEHKSQVATHRYKSWFVIKEKGNWLGHARITEQDGVLVYLNPNDRNLGYEEKVNSALNVF